MNCFASGLDGINEYDSSTSIKALIARQEAAKYLLSVGVSPYSSISCIACDRARREAERRATMSEKLMAQQEKEDKTIAMLRELAASKGYL